MPEKVTELQHLKIKLKVLEAEASNRATLYEANTLHTEATVKDFAARSMGTAVAWVTSEMIYNIILVLADSAAYHGTAQMLTPEQEFWARTGYAVLCMLCCPPVLWMLRPSGGQTKGFSFSADFLTLVQGSTPMILMWAIMDMFVALMKWANRPGWDELIVAIVLTSFVALLELLPCYTRAKAAVDAGGAGDTMVGRYKTLPSYTVLAIGRMWNEFVNWPISDLQSKVAGKPNLIFMIQMVYYLILSYLITWITAQWSEKSEVLQKRFGEGDERHHLTAVEHHAADMERTAGQLFISSIAFVYAWGLSNTLQDFFFVLMCECSSPSSCSFAANCAYAVILTIVFTGVAADIKFQDRKEPWGKAHQALKILSMSLCVGWAWKGYFNTSILAIQAELSRGRVVCFVILFFLLWLLAGVWWHAFLKEKRRNKRQRDQDFKKTAVDVKVLVDETCAEENVTVV
mmetsp:Transcript_97641/g.237428  ORF Transcript_97641/g.237428 Transcript_97641/m.237428 type:complete len:459 (+) Transcript_97641:23-1399(+)